VFFSWLFADLAVVVSELSQLFWELEHADMASITPTMELAKLALVTSKDEEDVHFFPSLRPRLQRAT